MRLRNNYRRQEGTPPFVPRYLAEKEFETSEFKEGLEYFKLNCQRLGVELKHDPSKGLYNFKRLAEKRNGKIKFFDSRTYVQDSGKEPVITCGAEGEREKEK